MCFQINRENAATATIVGIMIKINEIYIYIYIYIFVGILTSWFGTSQSRDYIFSPECFVENLF